jgi:hypothetical protein
LNGYRLPIKMVQEKQISTTNSDIKVCLFFFCINNSLKTTSARYMMTFYNFFLFFRGDWSGISLSPAVIAINLLFST